MKTWVRSWQTPVPASKALAAVVLALAGPGV
jgi:hypothetical protein